MLRRKRSGGGVSLGLILLMSVAMNSETVVDRWEAARATKAWATAVADSSQPKRVPAPTDRIVVRRGRDDVVIYAATETDFGLGEPALSRDGTRIAFTKSEKLAGRDRKQLFVANSDGSDLKPVLDFQRPGNYLIGVFLGDPAIAWAHDNHALVADARIQPLAAPAERALVHVDLHA